jgi:hypothetical protein
MLVLSRKPGERLVIDDRIKVTVLEVRGHQIQLGIEAPRKSRSSGRNCFVPRWQRLEWTYDDQEGCR